MEVFSIFGPVSLAGTHLFAVVTLEARKSNGHHMLPLTWGPWFVNLPSKDSGAINSHMFDCACLALFYFEPVIFWNMWKVFKTESLKSWMFFNLKWFGFPVQSWNHWLQLCRLFWLLEFVFHLRRCALDLSIYGYVQFWQLWYVWHMVATSAGMTQIQSMKNGTYVQECGKMGGRWGERNLLAFCCFFF